MSDTDKEPGYFDYGDMTAPVSPLGITPKSIWLTERYHDILEAMFRFRIASRQIPMEWIDELVIIRNYLDNEVNPN